MTAPEKHPQHAGLDELRRRLDKARGIEQVLSVYQRILETAEELRSSPELRNRAAELSLHAKEDGQTARDTASSWRRPEIPRCTAETPSDGLGDYFQRIGAVAAGGGGARAPIPAILPRNGRLRHGTHGTRTGPRRLQRSIVHGHAGRDGTGLIPVAGSVSRDGRARTAVRLCPCGPALAARPPSTA